MAGSIVGRIFLYAVVVFVGGALGGLTGGGFSLGALAAGIASPILLPFAMIFSTEGFVIAPLLFLFLFVYARFELSLYFLLIPLCMSWYFSHVFVSRTYEVDPIEKRIMENADS
ncbi:MAG: hypothetical protein NWT08_11980 [Akkermansiaceae bacterium]|nr:hypothetical protein [Akkermansiaceae bacterium]MDP4646336.1 hypothetical protein [Akkermansiaceae bacterium]MDP4720171.1 hypothetical protein [Akkermansiaceae bacterium]MDP4779939.1 hypothetical protein [Akkermansiaceae bacterium]MDP4847135.1 hypothetical protein [Akkermansiaceae bacterium]